MNRNLNSLLFPGKKTLIILLFSLLLYGLTGCSKTNNEQDAKNAKEKIMKYQIPNSISAEHKELHRLLEEAIKSGGNTGEAAKVVADRLHSHFENEEKYALPQLGLLSQLAEGKTSEDMNEAIKLSDKLKAELPQMLEEHKAIVVALDNLANAARSENKLPVVEFTEKLKMHAQNEEEILYPAAILIGEYLKLRLQPEESLRRINPHERGETFFSDTKNVEAKTAS